MQGRLPARPIRAPITPLGCRLRSGTCAAVPRLSRIRAGNRFSAMALRSSCSPHWLRRPHHGSAMASTMLNVNVDRCGPVPLHDQVAAQIRRAIADGEAGPGERLPLAKDLAAGLGGNRNTVLRALHILREEVLLEFRLGRGIAVAGTPERGAVLARLTYLLESPRQPRFSPG